MKDILRKTQGTKRRQYSDIFLDITNHTRQWVAQMGSLASLTLAVLLTCVPTVHAIVIDGGPPPPQCSLSASLSATPSVDQSKHQP